MKVGIISPRREACGISDYTSALAPALGSLVDVTYVSDPDSFTPAMNEVDLVHVQHEYFVFGGVAPWKNRFSRFISQVTRPVVMTVHEIVSPAGNPAFRAAVNLSNKLHFADRRIRRHIVHTNLDRRRIGDILGKPRTVEVIRLAVPDSPTLPSSEESRRKLGLQNQFVVTIFGFIARKKDYLLALDAVKLLPDEVVLLIAGGRHPDDTTDYVDSVTNSANELGVRARITGYISHEEILNVMAATDLILAPFSESSGSASLAMAFACGLPILASDIEPHREISLDTPGSIALAGRTPDQLAQSITRIRADDPLLASLRDGSLRYARNHSMSKTAEQTARVYESVMAESRD